MEEDVRGLDIPAIGNEKRFRLRDGKEKFDEILTYGTNPYNATNR